MRVRAIPAALLLLATAGVLPAASQEAAAADEPVRVFIDCSYHCDQDFLRTEVNWVSYMRDRADAQVHVLVTTQSTGGGGTQYTFNFIGMKQFAGVADTLRYTASPDDSQDLRRRGITRTIALGLVPFVARTPFASRLSVTAPQQPEEGAAAVPAAPAADPWDFWTFRIGTNGWGNGESQTMYYSINGNVSANRVTEAWKINLGINGNYRENSFEYEIDGVAKKTVSITRNFGFNSLVAKSLGPHLSAGFRTSVNTSTFGNTSLGLTLAPAVEYNFVPYSESTRRAFLVRYSAGARYADYREITIFGEVEETRPTHSLDIEYSTTQPWGRVYLSLDGSQYLHDTQKYNAGIGGSTEIRLFKGFSFNIGGNYTLVRDQLSLPGRELTEEEILLQQRQMATNYQYYVSAGVSYRFGSIFNSIVNPRFGGGSGGGMMIIM
jgi:hypothetical protein